MQLVRTLYDPVGLDLYMKSIFPWDMSLYVARRHHGGTSVHPEMKTSTTCSVQTNPKIEKPLRQNVKVAAAQFCFRAQNNMTALE